jgi:hypothetical protein
METNKLLSTDLQSAVKLLETAENESRDKFKAAGEELEKACDTDKLEEATKQAQNGAQKMSDRIEQSETSFNQAVDTFSEMREVMSKMVG